MYKRRGLHGRGRLRDLDIPESHSTLVEERLRLVIGDPSGFQVTPPPGKSTARWPLRAPNKRHGYLPMPTQHDPSHHRWYTPEPNASLMRTIAWQGIGRADP